MLRSKASLGSYSELILTAGLGSLLGSGVIIMLSATLTVWESGMGLTTLEVGLLSSILTFSIALGSFSAGPLTKLFSLRDSFGLYSLFYAVGMTLAGFSRSLWMLAVGVGVAGFASGADLPVSLTVLSHDAENEEISSRLVASSQIFWQAGVIFSYLVGFITSNLTGLMGARISLLSLAGISFITFLWRVSSPSLRRLHERGDKIHESEMKSEKRENIISFLIRSENQSYLKKFFSIMLYFVLWNLLANTFGQFQTYMLVSVNASQSLATLYGLVINIVGIFLIIAFASAVAGKKRNLFFYTGILMQAISMMGLALLTQSLILTISLMALYTLGSLTAGEGIYKVWTQESFPEGMRASAQGLINGVSRVCCGLFAIVTPALTAPRIMNITMGAFALIILVAGASGLYMIKSESPVHRPEVNVTVKEN